jgi:hypothetical protein
MRGASLAFSKVSARYFAASSVSSIHSAIDRPTGIPVALDIRVNASCTSAETGIVKRIVFGFSWVGGEVVFIWCIVHQLAPNRKSVFQDAGTA